MSAEWPSDTHDVSLPPRDVKRTSAFTQSPLSPGREGLVGYCVRSNKADKVGGVGSPRPIWESSAINYRRCGLLY